MKWIQATFIVVWAPGKFLLFFFIHLTLFSLFTGFNLQQHNYHNDDDNNSLPTATP
jgi:hypothetical protein